MLIISWRNDAAACVADARAGACVRCVTYGRWLAAAVAPHAPAACAPHLRQSTMTAAGGTLAALCFALQLMFPLGLWHVSLALLLLSSWRGPCWQHRDHDGSGIFRFCAECSQIWAVGGTAVGTVVPAECAWGSGAGSGHALAADPDAHLPPLLHGAYRLRLRAGRLLLAARCGSLLRLCVGATTFCEGLLCAPARAGRAPKRRSALTRSPARRRTSDTALQPARLSREVRYRDPWGRGLTVTRQSGGAAGSPRIVLLG